MSNNNVKRFFLNCRIFYFHRKIISDYLYNCSNLNQNQINALKFYVLFPSIYLLRKFPRGRPLELKLRQLTRKIREIKAVAVLP